MSKPVSMLAATCRLTAVSRRTNRREAIGYFITENDALSYAAYNERTMGRYHSDTVIVEFPDADGEYIKLGLVMAEPRPVYDGRAALKLAYDEELRKAGAANVRTLTVLIGNALHTAEEGHTFAAVHDAKAAAEYARRLGRELTKVAKAMDEAALLARQGITADVADL